MEIIVGVNNVSLSWPQKRFKAQLGLRLPSGLATPVACGDHTWRWGSVATLQVRPECDNAYLVQWTSTCLTAFEDAIVAGDTLWMVGPEEHKQDFPLQPQGRMQSPAPLLPGDFLQDSTKFFGGVCEPYWLSSHGVAIYALSAQPLFYHWMDGQMRLSSKRSLPYQHVEELKLSYYVFSAGNARETHFYAVKRFLGQPAGMIDQDVLLKPIWSTWAQYKSNVREDDVRELAINLKKYDLRCSQIEIDDRWERNYGDMAFDREKFPNVRELVDDLRGEGFKVSLWTHPFLNLDSQHYAEAAKRGFLVQDRRQDGHSVVANTRWWQGNPTGVIDFTNDEASAWWIAKLDRLRRDMGIDAFKFDAGETCWLPTAASLNAPEEYWPGAYTTSFAKRVIDFGGARTEVRVGRMSQKWPSLVRMLDKDSSWGRENGLKSLIPSALQISLSGYPFVLPDMIGGNGYGDGSSQEENNTLSCRPSKELYVRWMQASVLMPSVQFSFVPWEYGEDVANYAKKLIDVRMEMKELFVKSAERVVESGEPMLKPIWWEDPEDQRAVSVGDAFLMGAKELDQMLIAPVLERGMRERDVYLPSGTWKELFNEEETLTGPMWLRKVKADLWTLPLYKRVKE